MEIVCNTCGSIGIWFPRDMAKEWATYHVEGRPHTNPRKVLPAHPGHVVTIVPDSSPSMFSI